MAADYHFGIEIEVIVGPHKVRSPLNTKHALYYGKLAASLRKRGLKAQADDLQNGYTKRPEHYDKWWITKDGSLGSHTDKIPMEAVSPVMSLRANWEHEIDIFWTAMSAVFHMPDRSLLCGSHIHVSKGLNETFTLPQLKKIAFGVIYYEPLILQLLMRERANNRYCKPNTLNSTQLMACNGNFNAVATLINSARSATALKNMMQNDRYVLWNFDNVVPNGSGTIEFRGGRCLRGKVRTKRWIAFTIALIQALLNMNNIQNPNVQTIESYTPEGLYTAIKTAAGRLSLRESLPEDWKVLNESQR
ncbi:swim zinc finger domain protein [Fusarium beomiforme]|uniref:Swim zinc finger domain protein n=1 Tax=Fusarium beomiforme TaxID=44412 RepID=A0A9P5AN83_9HYPO|nr:swim zinc finger domain protein [Fusarium beomiforme]